MTEQGQELVKQEQRSAVVTKVPVPKQLAELGVRIGRDGDSGMAVVMIPPDVRRSLNVINPVSSFAQADPNWSPSISLVQLDKEAHSYNVSGKLGLNKQALETLGLAGGIVETKVRRLKADELGEGERWGYEATVKIRKSDGTLIPTTRSRTFNEEAEKAEIEDSVRAAKSDSGPRFNTEEKVAAECRKRWINELKMGPAKTESKAINRAIRAALQVPTSLKPADFGKPFLVIGYSFTPDYDDVEIRRMLVAAGIGGTDALYGRARELEAGAPDSDLDVEARDVDETARAEDDEAATDTGEGSGDEAEQTQQADSEGEGTPNGASSESVPGDDPEPGPEPEEEAQSSLEGFSPPDDVVDVIAQTVVETGQWKGRTLEQIAADDAGEQWLLWACRQPDDRLPDDLRAKVHAFVKARVPAVWDLYNEGGAA